MPKFAANVSMLFTELPFLQRFAAAAAAGFKGVEFLFPYAFPADAIAEQLQKHGLKQVLFNGPPGDLEAGERGLAAIPGRENEFRESIDLALRYAESMDCPCVHVMAGIPPPSLAWGDARATYIENLRYAGERCADAGRYALIEPINKYDVPGYFLNYSYDAMAIINELALDSVALQFDCYHCQIMEGNLAVHLHELQGATRHIQISGVPGRHEPDIGEIHYPYLFTLLDEFGYQGWVGCEYHPRGETRAGLAWFESYRESG